MNYSAVLFDFGGVLCTDRFYTTLLIEYPKVYTWIQEHVFGKENVIGKKWMRGEVGYQEVNKYIAENTKIDLLVLEKLFLESVRRMKVDERLLKIILNLKKQFVKTALVTDNMDVFREITIVNHHLYDYFDVITTSTEYGIFKNEQNGKLFDITLQKLGIDSFKNTLFIDDSPSTVELYKTKGGEAFQYSSFEEFDKWFKKNKY